MSFKTIEEALAGHYCEVRGDLNDAHDAMYLDCPMESGLVRHVFGKLRQYTDTDTWNYDHLKDTPCPEPLCKDGRIFVGSIWDEMVTLLAHPNTCVVENCSQPQEVERILKLVKTDGS